jgi:hypothetical protein
MRRHIVIGAAVGLICVLGLAVGTLSQNAPRADWRIKATNIEACSCEMFCPCYFVASPSPAASAHAQHGGAGGEKFCRFNNAFKIESGQFNETKLDGLKFWMAGDLGGDFSKGFDWAVITFEPSATPKQREGVKAIVQSIFPGTWKSFTEGKDATIDWSVEKDRAVARLDDGKAAEILLKRNQGMTDDPIVIHNLKFWAAPRNDGFKLMQNEMQAYKVGDKAFETKGTNGFVVTIEMSSDDVKKAKS